MSFFVPWRTRTNAALVPLAVGVALADAVAATGRRVALKWPNDLVAIDGEHQDRKVAGMLSELINDPRGRSAGSPDVLGVVIGCGINVSWPSPTDIAAADGSLDNAACLEQLGGDSVDRATFAFDLIERTDQELRQWEIEGAKNLVDRYRARCGTIGRRVRIDQADGRSLIGFATDVDDAGRLVLESSGSVRRIDVGDVDHLRPDDRM